MRWFLAALALLAADPPRGAPVATIELRLERADHFLPAPAGRSVKFKLDARAAPPKCRIMFTTPLPAGEHRYQIEIAGGRPDRTLTIATPVAAGRSTFQVSITGQGRVDLGFWSSAPVPKEYRFTLAAPVEGRRFELDMPTAPAGQ
jgi:hypothetical protein